ncbi:MAG: hypothetical protein C0459_00950 [Chitinophaga sp.]|jgi:hypothetical protein|nr:hypothetical protein [Chitinophaga sp.]
MKRYYTIILFIFFLNISLTNIRAQDSTINNKNDSSSLKIKHGLFKTQLSYLSNSAFNGRVDSLPIPYLNYSIKYLNYKGFYISSNASLLISSYAQRIDLFNIEAGYEADINKNISVSIVGTKDFYNPKSTAIKSETVGSLNAAIAYNSKYLNFSMGSDILFTTGKTDYLLNLSLSHEFSFVDDQFNIEPTLSSNFGTRYYHDRYITVRQKKNGKSSAGSSTTTTTSGISTITTTTTVNSNNPEQYVVMDYELSLPIYYYGKKWGLFFTPTFAIPQSPITYITTTTTTTTTNNVSNTTSKKSLFDEDITNIFYVEAGIFFKFK